MLSNWFVNIHLRYGTKPLMAVLRDHGHIRAIADLYARTMFRVSPEMRFAPGDLGGVPCLWCDTGNPASGQAMLYLHGGGYTIGGYTSHKGMVAEIAGRSGLRAALLNYRRAPEHPYPAAIDDAETAYRALLDQGMGAGDIVLGGDSAGGGMVFALLLRLHRLGLPYPRACFAISPWADLGMAGASYSDNRRSEVMLPPAWLARTSAAYLAGQDPANPDISPVHGAFHAPPDTLIVYGTDEALASDSPALADRLRAGGGQVDLIAEQGLPHVWTFYHGKFAPADRSIGQIAAFVRDKCTDQGGRHDQ